MDEEWIKSVYFKRLAIKYRAVTEGYLGDWPLGKLRAVVKEIVQSISPCLHQKVISCQDCTLKETCCFFNLMVERRHREYLPYFLSAKDENNWQGPISKGSGHSLEMYLIGDAINWLEELELGFRRKVLISLNDISGHNVGFELVSVEMKNNGSPMSIVDLYPRFARESVQGQGKIEHITIEFITPHSLIYNNTFIKNREDMNFEAFLNALHIRIASLATHYCGFIGEIPDRIQFVTTGQEMTTHLHPDFRYVSDKIDTRRGKKEFVQGLKGRVSFSGRLTAFFPLVVLGETLHIGRKTTQGLGKYRILEINHRPLQ